MKKLLLIVGPTATGKTAMSLRLAHELNAEIISADSVQVYKGLDIGSAKLMLGEMQGIVHHMIDVVEPDQNYSVSDYKEQAIACIEDIYKRGKQPIVVGGTGFYIHSLLYDMNFQGTPPNEALRKSLHELVQREGNLALYARLQELNPEFAKTVHPNNTKRVIRAIEIASASDKPVDFNAFESQAKLNYDVQMNVLNMDRQSLYQRIDKRVDLMMEAGLLQEVRALLDRGLNRSCQSMQSIGYKELISYFEGETTLSQAVDLIKQKSRNYAKRQLTWFKKYDFANWIDVNVN